MKYEKSWLYLGAKGIFDGGDLWDCLMVVGFVAFWIIRTEIEPRFLVFHS